MLQDFGILIFSLAIILLGAEVFTNGIEWLGKKLRLAEGAVGSVLAAVGTALPETMIPIIAIFFGTEEVGKEIGIGAILGAPFMLATLALFMTGAAGLVYRRKRLRFPRMNINPIILERDLSFFIVLYTLALLAAFLPFHIGKMVIAGTLVFMYLIYVYITINSGEPVGSSHKINPCIFDRKCPNNPSLRKIILQVIIALGLIIIGAKFFVNEIEKLSLIFGVPGFVLALIIAPVATELPEKFNSIIWISQGKDTLAMGNITGAMVFQSSLIPALGIVLTPWNLSTKAVISVVLALVSASLLLFYLKRKGHITVYILMFNGVFYLMFIYLVVNRIFF
ncbi:sodium:calcium antiporter [Desulfitibacter alkalitolerans]|uniref:sodium:calcium antiporter n=1 Tax=Desulfitibacter alkalitolerans TaxID=264641 RepID=UPI000482750B|nr:sodium:calcium antiporter [Desulfitibacter alkalitolerans]